jgi:hypothetical protein
MFGLTKKRGPSQPFSHSDDCKILQSDPEVQIEWSEVATGRWEAVCVCGHEYFNEPFSDDRVRLDPYDPSTFRHAPTCEHRETDDPALLRAILRVRDGAGGGYWWVECSSCDFSWQTPHYPYTMRLMATPKPARKGAGFLDGDSIPSQYK